MKLKICNELVLNIPNPSILGVSNRVSSATYLRASQVHFSVQHEALSVCLIKATTRCH